MISSFVLVVIKLFWSGLFMYFVEVTIFWNLSSTDSHRRIFVHYVPPHVLHPPKSLLTFILLPTQTEVVELGEDRPLKAAKTQRK